MLLSSQQPTSVEMAPPMIDPQIFDQLKNKLDEDTKVQKSLSEIIDQLETQIAYAQGLLSRIHGTPRAECTSYSYIPFRPG
jgi:hypothetical protein